MFPARSHLTPARIAVVALLAVPLAVFFAPSLIAGNAPGGFDLVYQSSPWRDEPHRPLDAQSPVQIDQAEQLPWVDGMWQTLLDGRVPMWTPAVGGGTALGTNPVFTTYSVFTVVGQLVGALTTVAIGLVVRVVLAVAVAEAFTYLVLRRVGVGAGAAVFGTVAYVFSGSVIAFQTRNAIPLLLPVLVWCTDRLAERVTSWRMVALAAAVVALWMEGFPAMLVHAVVIAGLWWVVRTAQVVGLGLRRREVLTAWVGRAAAYGGGLGLGLAVSAVSIVPFGLQLSYNDVFGARSDVATNLGGVNAWWLLDDGALGVPDRGPWISGLNPFEGVAAAGTLVVAAAVVGAVAGLLRRRDPRVSSGVRWFWMATVGVLVVSIYLGGPALDALYALPGFHGNPFSRSRYVLAFGLAVLAAVGLDAAFPSRSAEPGGAEPGAVEPRRRWVDGAFALVFVVALVSPFVDSLGAYRDLVRQHRDLILGSWRSEAIAFAVAAVVVGGMAFVARRARSAGGGSLPWIGLAAGGVAAAVAFTQVGLQITRLTPQVDRAFYYPETPGHDVLRSLTGDRSRFIGTGMGTFTPNTAMTDGLVDARSHSFRDPQWKALVLAAFPDALAADPLKINVDLHGRVEWGSPVLDDLALGVLVMSSSEVPLGDRVGAPDAATWDEARGDATVVGDAPAVPLVGIDLRLDATGDCAQGDVVVTAAPDGSSGDDLRTARRPLGDVRAAGAAGVGLPFALPLADLATGAGASLSLALDGAPADCVLRVGRTDDGALAVAPITRPVDADWELAAADGGWFYVRDAAHPLVRTIDRWTPFSRPAAALEAAVDPNRVAADPMPVADAGPVPADATEGAVRSWSADDHGVSAVVESDGPTMLVASFNHAPGWVVTVDGEDADLVRPDGALLGVEVPAGRHEVRFEYRMPGLRAGAALSLLGLLGCVGVVVAPAWWRRRRTSGPGGTGGLSEDGAPPDDPTAAGAGSPGTPAAAAPD